MKNYALLLIGMLFVCFTTLSAETTNESCYWECKYAYPQKGKTYYEGDDIYVKLDFRKHHDIDWVECYINGKFIRKENSYPFEWCKRGSNGDHYLRNMRKGTYKLMCKIKTKCGDYHKYYCTIIVKGHGGGGGGGHHNCDYKVDFKYPKNKQTYEAGSSIYVELNAYNHQKIKYCELYLNDRFVRTEKSYPYQWCKRGSNGDGYLRNLKPGTYKLKCVVYDYCGHKQVYYCIFYVKGHGGGGGHNACVWECTYNFPINCSFKAGQDVYVKVNPKRYQDVDYMILYCNGKMIRKENSYPYEWGRKGGNGDYYLRKCKKGHYNLKCIIVDKCGNKHEKKWAFRVV